MQIALRIGKTALKMLDRNDDRLLRQALFRSELHKKCVGLIVVIILTECNIHARSGGTNATLARKSRAHKPVKASLPVLKLGEC
ncbi:hypothetical protein [Herminiimonas aquatilis]|uniref:hypothetical protein n=1 Tax=Herminiimonas aquatilis TaxID=345342 RepID=UPI0036D38720